VPAPLGKTPTKKMPKIDVFGLENSASTRSAVRFFRERRIVVRFVDLGKQPIEAAELRTFVERLGAGAVLAGEPGDGAAAGSADRAAGSVDRGAGSVDRGADSVDRGALPARVRADATLLRLPLVRHGDEMTAGPDETTWKAWLARRR
jgi:arsenate reductase-like glutaredoxin family protein